MTTPKKTTLKVINTKINRLRSQKTALEFKEKSQTKQQRMKRTRTLIQTGGLLKVAGILERFSHL